MWQLSHKVSCVAVLKDVSLRLDTQVPDQHVAVQCCDRTPTSRLETVRVVMMNEDIHKAEDAMIPSSCKMVARFSELLLPLFDRTLLFSSYSQLTLPFIDRSNSPLGLISPLLKIRSS